MLKEIGKLNEGWGICGFTSSLSALYQHHPNRVERLAPENMLAEIKAYLRKLQANGSQELLNEIETFTRSFQGFDSFQITSYIQKINSVARTGKADSNDSEFSIAMPPDAVVDYLKWIGVNASICDSNSQTIQLILGLSTQERLSRGYKGLAHYVYSSHSVIYSWGYEFKSLSGLRGGYEICCKIAVE